ncbi:hypothetical protein DCAR_0729156 [Daucus carota subsp. sativus]|uniref:GRF-type domain-containing protein n=1 Tax=Daucus carota subsp. sativus TaxID=79200 RepID=A0AAF1B9I2_DAUCS|nr:hypothetical protein DCAR_0729156 [Daucus carota subsp. sativus]
MSTSKSSSASNASVNNSLNSCKSYRNASGVDYRYGNMKCKCDIVSPLQEAWKETTQDPGRRFFGCQNYRDPMKKCNYFLWADPPYTDRAREVKGHEQNGLHSRLSHCTDYSFARFSSSPFDSSPQLSDSTFTTSLAPPPLLTSSSTSFGRVTRTSIPDRVRTMLAIRVYMS